MEVNRNYLRAISAIEKHRNVGLQMATPTNRPNLWWSTLSKERINRNRRLIEIRNAIKNIEFSGRSDLAAQLRSYANTVGILINTRALNENSNYTNNNINIRKRLINRHLKLRNRLNVAINNNTRNGPQNERVRRLLRKAKLLSQNWDMFLGYYMAGSDRLGSMWRSSTNDIIRQLTDVARRRGINNNNRSNSNSNSNSNNNRMSVNSNEALNVAFANNSEQYKRGVNWGIQANRRTPGVDIWYNRDGRVKPINQNVLRNPIMLNNYNARQLNNLYFNPDFPQRILLLKNELVRARGVQPGLSGTQVTRPRLLPNDVKNAIRRYMADRARNTRAARRLGR